MTQNVLGLGPGDVHICNLESTTNNLLVRPHLLAATRVALTLVDKVEQSEGLCMYLQTGFVP